VPYRVPVCCARSRERVATPLWVTELVAALRREGSIKDAEGTAELATVGIPPSLPLTILHRLSFLAPSTLEVLRVASVLGTTFAVTDLSLVLGRPTTGLLDALDEAMAGRILDRHGVELAFRHDLIREALYQDLSAAVRRGLHLDAAHALAGAGSPPEQVAEHLMRGASPGDTRAVAWLRQAAHRAAPRAPAVAVELLQRALHLSPLTDPNRDTLLAEQAVSLMWSGRLADAEASCREVLSRVHDPALDGTLRLCRLQALVGRGRLEEALLEADAATTSPTLSDVERARFQAFTAMARTSSGQLQAAQTAADARAAAEQTGDDLAAAVSLANLALVTNLGGDFTGALVLAGEAVQRADRSEGLGAHRFPLNLFLGGCLHDLDRIGDGQAALQRGRRLAEELGAKRELPLYYWALAQGCFWAGEWDDALAECQACLELADEYGMRLHGTLFSHSIRAVIVLHRGDLPAAERAVAAAQRELAATGPSWGSTGWGGRTRWCWRRWGSARRRWPRSAGHGRCAPTKGCSPPCPSSAQTWSAWPATPATPNAPSRPPAPWRPSRHATPVWRHWWARHCAVGAYWRTARRCCCGRWMRTGTGPGRWRSRSPARTPPWRWAAREACSGRARSLMTPSALYERLQASRDVARAEARLRALGLRRGRRGPRRRPTSGWDSLTRTELKVARLVAEGLSNPEIAERPFISRGTVHTHVSHVLAKLGIRSRVGLAAEAIRRRV
jgi:DNA-binding CsgD family transcriptional regulator/tetratricopeptide (TPR) repeat protein